MIVSRTRNLLPQNSNISARNAKPRCVPRLVSVENISLADFIFTRSPVEIVSVGDTGVERVFDVYLKTRHFSHARNHWSKCLISDQPTFPARISLKYCLRSHRGNCRLARLSSVA